MKNTLTEGSRGFQLIPGYDYRNDPEYGQHPPEMFFYVKGKHGAVVWTVATGWYLNGKLAEPYSVLSYHEELTIANSSDNEYSISDSCKYLEGRSCCVSSHYVSDTLNIQTLREGGLDKIYETLERLYLEKFGEPV